MKKIVLITNHFPFGIKETFLEDEITYLSEHFQVYIIAKNTKDKRIRNISERVKIFRYNPQSGVIQFVKTPLFIIISFKSFIKYFANEIFHLFKIRKANGKRIYKAFHQLVKAIQFKEFLIEKIKKENLAGSIMYSYWFDTSALAIALIQAKHDIKRISRAHGSDLYYHVHKLNYLPFHKVKVKKLNGIYCISEYGRDYLTNLMNENSNNVFISKLGVNKTGERKLYNIPEKNFYLLSCSYITSIKRIDLIIDSLALCKNEKIYWTHIGDGPLRIKVEAYASKKLKSKKNIAYSFIGSMQHFKVMEFYKTHPVDLFILLSYSEGIPVSIMEAMAYGIPVLANNVGGVNEIVTNKNGFLLDKDVLTNEVADKISFYYQLPLKEKKEMQQAAYHTWNEKFNAKINYMTFIKNIEKL